MGHLPSACPSVLPGLGDNAAHGPLSEQKPPLQRAIYRRAGSSLCASELKEDVSETKWKNRPVFTFKSCRLDVKDKKVTAVEKEKMSAL